MSDRDGKVAPITINLIEGNVAPRFDETTFELTPLVVNIIEQGMASGLPMVDFKFIGSDGQHYGFTTSGRMVLAIASAIRGVNQRIHGKPEP